MKGGPFDQKSCHAWGQPASKDRQIVNINEGLGASILRMKMWGTMVLKEHLDHDAENRLISGMGSLAPQCGEDVLWLLSCYLEVQGVRAQINLVVPDKFS